MGAVAGVFVGQDCVSGSWLPSWSRGRHVAGTSDMGVDRLTEVVPWSSTHRVCSPAAGCSATAFIRVPREQHGGGRTPPCLVPTPRSLFATRGALGRVPLHLNWVLPLVPRVTHASSAHQCSLSALPPQHLTLSHMLIFASPVYVK